MTTVFPHGTYLDFHKVTINLVAQHYLSTIVEKCESTCGFIRPPLQNRRYMVNRKRGEQWQECKFLGSKVPYKHHASVCRCVALRNGTTKEHNVCHDPGSGRQHTYSAHVLSIESESDAVRVEPRAHVTLHTSQPTERAKLLDQYNMRQQSRP